MVFFKNPTFSEFFLKPQRKEFPQRKEKFQTSFSEESPFSAVSKTYRKTLSLSASSRSIMNKRIVNPINELPP
jgi:hypothetical protein